MYRVSAVFISTVKWLKEALIKSLLLSHCEHFTPLHGHKSGKNRFMRLSERSEAISLAWERSPGDCRVASAPRNDELIRGSLVSVGKEQLFLAQLVGRNCILPLAA